MKNKPVPGCKTINGHRYYLASQDVPKTIAKQKAKDFRSWGYKAQVLPMHGSYRVYKHPHYVWQKKKQP